MSVDNFHVISCVPFFFSHFACFSHLADVSQIVCSQLLVREHHMKFLSTSVCFPSKTLKEYFKNRSTSHTKKSANYLFGLDTLYSFCSRSVSVCECLGRLSVLLGCSLFICTFCWLIRLSVWEVRNFFKTFKLFISVFT